MKNVVPAHATDFFADMRARKEAFLKQARRWEITKKEIVFYEGQINTYYYIKSGAVFVFKAISL